VQSLKNVISALRREIDEALKENRALSDGTRLEAERIVLSLDVSITERRSQDGTAELSFELVELTAKQPAAKASLGKAKPHTLTIEFKRSSAGEVTSTSASTRPKGEEISRPAGPSDEAARDDVLKLLSDIFGAPGFDSSARATVFREALARLKEKDARLVIKSLSGKPATDLHDDARQARHLMSNVLRSGPLKSASRGGEVLTRVFEKHSVASIARLIEETWKTQDEWLDKTLPRPRSNGKPSSSNSADTEG
jgi:hypothetical protein